LSGLNTVIIDTDKKDGKAVSGVVYSTVFELLTFYQVNFSPSLI